MASGSLLMNALTQRSRGSESISSALTARVAGSAIRAPSAPKTHSKLTRFSAVAAHIALYALLFAILISGYLISTADGKPISVFGLFEVPATLSDAGVQADTAGVVHLWLAWSVVILSVLHGLAALKHHFIDKDDTLKRMLGRSSVDSGA